MHTQKRAFNNRQSRLKNTFKQNEREALLALATEKIKPLQWIKWQQ